MALDNSKALGLSHRLRQKWQEEIVWILLESLGFFETKGHKYAVPSVDCPD